MASSSVTGRSARKPPRRFHEPLSHTTAHDRHEPGIWGDGRGRRMSSEIAYALAALVCYGLGDFIYKRAASAGIAAEHFLMGQAWFFCPTVIAYAWITGTLDFEQPAMWGGLAGLFILIGFFYYVRSLRSGSVSIIAPVFRLNFLVTAAL